MKKVAIIGIQGLPANYGGFETLVENIIQETSSTEIQYIVFCSSKDFKTKISRYKGAKLKYIPLKANGIQSIPYDILSMCKAIRGYDILLVLGTSGCIFLPFFRIFNRKKLIVNIDGLEHRRAKWGNVAKHFLRISEKFAVKFADTIIVDNKGIENYVSQNYKKRTSLIAYGGDHVLTEVSDIRQQEVLNLYNLTSGGYSLTICRIEPENNCHMTLEAFAKSNNRLVFIGNWNRNNYGRSLKDQYNHYSNITFIESLYEIEPLYVLRKHCQFYVHGHSAGGTNPSLVEAMFFGCPILAFNCVYNKETTNHSALYYNDTQELEQLLSVDNESAKESGKKMLVIASERYKWSHVVRQYEGLY